jgi:hypothetical protein
MFTTCLQRRDAQNARVAGANDSSVQKHNA